MQLGSHRTRLCEALMRATSGEELLSKRMDEDALAHAVWRVMAAIWMDHNRNAFFIMLACVPAMNECYLESRSESQRELMKFRLAHMNGIDHR